VELRAVELRAEELRGEELRGEERREELRLVVVLLEEVPAADRKFRQRPA
jgi:hypothetical protein